MCHDSSEQLTTLFHSMFHTNRNRPAEQIPSRWVHTSVFACDDQEMLNYLACRGANTLFRMVEHKQKR